MRNWLLAAMSLLVATAARAYEPIAVTAPAGISGRVTVSGEIPPTVTATVGAGACAGADSDPRRDVSSEGGLASTVVYLLDVERGLPLDPTDVAHLVISGCRFSPPALVGSVGQVLEIRNLDPLPHQVRAHASPDDNALFEVSLPLQNQAIKKRLKAPGLVRLECADGHVWAAAEVTVLDHPYATVSDSEGRFTLPSIPPGRYTVVARHARFGELRRSVTLAANSSQSLDFTFKAP